MTTPPLPDGLHDGLRSEALRKALDEALAGRPARLEDQLARLGATSTDKAKQRLGAAFGAELGARSGAVLPLLERFTAEDAAPDTGRVFLPMVAAHGWVARLRTGRDVGRAWAALGELAGDERAPVRLGVIDALVTYMVQTGHADQLVAQAQQWLELDDRETAFGAAAVMIEILGQGQVVASLDDREAMLAYVGQVIAAYSEAPRSAGRSEARRRGVLALPKTLAAVVAATGEPGRRWLADVCTTISHPELREALSETLIRLRSAAHGLPASAVDQLREVLKASAKPLRDPSRVRPGTGRGKGTRRIK